MRLPTSIVTQSKHYPGCMLGQHQACLSVPICMHVCQAMVGLDGVGTAAVWKACK